MRYRIVAVIIAALAVVVPLHARAGLIGQTITGQLDPAPHFNFTSVSSQFNPATVTIVGGDTFSGTLHDNSFGQNFNVTVSFTDTDITVALTGAYDDNVYNMYYGVGGLTLSGFSPEVTNLAQSGYSCSGNDYCSGSYGVMTDSFNGGTFSILFGDLLSGQTYTFGAQVAVPEPASFVLLATGLLGAGLVRRRKHVVR